MHSLCILSLALVATLPAVYSQVPVEESEATAPVSLEPVTVTLTETSLEPVTETLTETSTTTVTAGPEEVVNITSTPDIDINIHGGNVTFKEAERRDLSQPFLATKQEMTDLVGNMEPAEVREMMENNSKQTSDVVELAGDALQPPLVNNAVDMAYVIMNLGFYITNKENPTEVQELFASLPPNVQEAMSKRREEAQGANTAIDSASFYSWHTDLETHVVSTQIPYVATFTEARTVPQVTTVGSFPRITNYEVVETYRVTTTLDAAVTEIFQRPSNYIENVKGSSGVGAAATAVPGAALAGALGAAMLGMAMV